MFSFNYDKILKINLFVFHWGHFANDISISTEYKPYEKCCCCCKSLSKFLLFIIYKWCKTWKRGGLKVTLITLYNPNIINLGGEVANIWLSALSIGFIKLSFILFWLRWCQSYLWTLKYRQKCEISRFKDVFTIFHSFIFLSYSFIRGRGG